MKKLNIVFLSAALAVVSSAFAVPTTGAVSFSGPGATWDKDNKTIDFPSVSANDFPNISPNAFVNTVSGEFADYFTPTVFANGSYTGGSLATFYDFDYSDINSISINWASDDIVGPVDNGLITFSMTDVDSIIESIGVPNEIDSLEIFGVGIIEDTSGSSTSVNAQITFNGNGNSTFTWSSVTTVLPVPDHASTLSTMVLGLVSLAAASRRKTK